MHREVTSPSPSSRNFFPHAKSFRRTPEGHCYCQVQKVQRYSFSEPLSFSAEPLLDLASSRGGAVWAAPLSGGRKAAAGVGHGAAHLLQLVADARKRPGVRAVQGQGGGDGEQGANAALSRSTTVSEENDSRSLN